MTDQTDRIKQMAQEAGLVWSDGDGVYPAIADFTDMTPNLAKFAALVAEDCLKVLDDEADKAMNLGLGNDVYHLATWTDEAIRARYTLATPSQAG